MWSVLSKADRSNRGVSEADLENRQAGGLPGFDGNLLHFCYQSPPKKDFSSQMESDPQFIPSRKAEESQEGGKDI